MATDVGGPGTAATAGDTFANRTGESRRSDGAEAPVVPRRTAAPASWDDFTDRLVGVLGELEAEEYLVLESTLDHRFAQVAVQDFAIRVESVGEQFLDASSALTAEELTCLEHLGYDPATHGIDVDADRSEGSPNHWTELPTTTPLGSIAALLVDTLRQVHHVETPRQLTYECSSFLGDHIPQPVLGLSRTARP